MNSIEFHKYILSPKSNLNQKTPAKPRAGALIKINGGFADIFPWPEFGDLAIDQQLDSLKKNQPTNLVLQSLAFAKKDQNWRARGQTAFNKVALVVNHCLITDLQQNLTVPDLYQSVKIKMGPDWKDNIHTLNLFAQGNPNIKIRLDFNAALNLQSFTDFCEQCSPQLKKQIQFIEDPMPYDFENWKRAHKILPLACDFESTGVDWTATEVPFSVLVFKPARESLDSIMLKVKKFNLDLVVTSSLDHPVGCMHALATAIELKQQSGLKVLDSGCQTWGNYPEDIFSKHIHSRGPVVLGPGGLGIGFDDILKNLNWEKL